MDNIIKSNQIQYRLIAWTCATPNTLYYDWSSDLLTFIGNNHDVNVMAQYILQCHLVIMDEWETISKAKTPERKRPFY